MAGPAVVDTRRSNRLLAVRRALEHGTEVKILHLLTKIAPGRGEEQQDRGALPLRRPSVLRQVDGLRELGRGDRAGRQQQPHTHQPPYHL
jgi:hypothetical protein